MPVASITAAPAALELYAEAFEAAGALPRRQMNGPTDPPAGHAPAPTPNTSRGGALDALRFAAALLIMLYHFGSESPIKLYRLNEVFARGYLATDFFLMLSGYVLGRAYGPSLLAKIGRAHV